MCQLVGILGGSNGPNPYAAYIYLNPPSAVSIYPTSIGGEVLSVAMNQFNLGIAGGQTSDNYAFLAFTDPTPSITRISGLPVSPNVSAINQVSINDFGQAIAGGVNNGACYAAYVFQNATAVSPISNLPTTTGALQSVAINNCGIGLIGGSSTSSQAYAAFVNPDTQSASSISGLPNFPNMTIHSVALNTSGQGLIGGDDTVSNAYVASVQADSSEANEIATGAQLINSVAINESGLGLIGGLTSTASYAAYVQPISHTVIPISNAAFSNGMINAVAINGSGVGIIGGTNDSSFAYAAYVNPNTFTAGPQIALLPQGIPSVINTVAINEFNQALVGGFDSSGDPYAAYVDPITQTAIAIANIPTSASPGSVINSVAMPFSSRIPTGSLSGNNLIFANYINQNAPRAVFYFLPALCSNGNNLAKSLESAAPTRNAFSLYAADNNLFILNHGLSAHLRNYHIVKNQELQKSETSVTRRNQISDQMLALSEEFHKMTMNETEKNSSSLPNTTLDHPYTVWFEGIGAFTFQKAQHQTVGFDPFVGGFIFAFDKNVTKNSLAGAGLAYTFTEISEDENQGHANINQEYLFGYATWASSGLYVDGALWLGCFQTHQVRNIQLTGFNFTATSNPVGLQLLPHFEFGYNWNTRCIVNPFVMIDWANAWQFSYQEKGSSPFNAGQNTHYSSLLRSEAGLRFYETVDFSLWRLIIEEKGSYVNTTSFGVGTVNAFLIGSPGFFTVETLNSAHNLGAFELSFIFESHNPKYPYGSLSYQGEFGSSFQSHQLIGEVSWDF